MTTLAKAGRVTGRRPAGRAGSVAALIAGRAARLLVLFAAAIALWFLLTMLLRPWYSQWGATEAEVTASLPGDDLVPNPISQSTWAITVNAPPEMVWPWLVQMGWGRGGFYTYEWIENGILQLGIANADRIVPEWQAISVGDHFWYYPEDYPMPRMGPRVVGILPNQALLLCHQVTQEETSCPGTWQFVLRPHADRTTRLILRSRGGDSPSAWFDSIFDPGYFFMGRGMLEGIAARAEGRTPSSMTNVAIAALWVVGFIAFAFSSLLMVVRAKWSAEFWVAVAGFAVLYLLAIWRPPLRAAALLDLGLLVAVLQAYRPPFTRLVTRIPSPEKGG